MTILCRGGITIYPAGGDRLAVDVDYHPGIAKKLAAIPGVTLAQDGDGEKTFVFFLGVAEEVFALVKPRKRRVLSEEHKAKLAAHWFPGKPG
jgi:hypothetical protein